METDVWQQHGAEVRASGVRLGVQTRRVHGMVRACPELTRALPAVLAAALAAGQRR